MDDAGLSTAVTVRRAAPDELAACAAIYVAVLRETFTWVDPERHRETDFYRAARDEEIYVALDGVRIVGVAGVYGPQNFLHSLYVTERGRGIGKALLDHVCACSDGPITLKCQTKNLRARAFYAREGFVCVEEGEDDGVAWLRLVRG